MSRYTIALGTIPRMMPMQEALNLTEESAIREQINLRRKLLREMVGQLYPSILQDELGILYKLLKDQDGENDYC